MHRHTTHLFRAGTLLVGGTVIFFVIRGLLIPRSFGAFGFYRGDNVAEQMDRTVGFAAKDACADCHADIWATHQAGAHASVQCQNCHDQLVVHVDTEKGELVGPMPIQKTAQLCLRCHMKLPSRPATFPQIDPSEHGEREGGTQQALPASSEKGNRERDVFAGVHGTPFATSRGGATRAPAMDVEQHLGDVPEAHRPDICFVCHAPHDPKGTVKP